MTTDKTWVSMVPPRTPGVESYPVVIPNWDNTPRSGRGGMVFEGATPELFRLQLRRAFEVIDSVDPEHNIVLVKSWNEWAEGNHLEPDLRVGRCWRLSGTNSLPSAQRVPSHRCSAEPMRHCR